MFAIFPTSDIRKQTERRATSFGMPCGRCYRSRLRSLRTIAHACPTEDGGGVQGRRRKVACQKPELFSTLGASFRGGGTGYDLGVVRIGGVLKLRGYRNEDRRGVARVAAGSLGGSVEHWVEQYEPEKNPRLDPGQVYVVEENGEIRATTAVLSLEVFVD